MMNNLHYSNVNIKDGFWKFYSDLDRNSTVNAVYDRFKETGRFDALKCNWTDGMPNQPHVFWDSDVAKWIEGVAYLTEIKKEPALEKLVDEMIEDIAKNQRDDGYFNSYFLTVAPSEIFKDRSQHELYCTGHLIEAAIAYHKATGKDTLLNCMLKNVDCIYNVFVKDQSAAFVTPGHQEIELALLKLYNYLGNEKHLELARFFLNKRGNNDIEKRSEYANDRMPIRELSTAVGHSVRAGYMYTAMAMLAKLDNDQELKEACLRLFDNITLRKMSITGGVGADRHEERYSYDYDLPNNETYNETCAAISLAMFSGAMQELYVNSRYGDVIERIYYNGMISGISLSGDEFFYANALEIDQKKYRRSTYQPSSKRSKVFNCSCCPPNMVRMLASIPRYMYTVDQNNVYCNQFINSDTTFEIEGKKAELTQTTNYPIDGKITFKYKGEPIKLHVRIPSWCVEYNGKTENGFASFDISDGQSITIELPMNVHIVEANPNIQYNSGRYAVTRGPIVYCMEGIDNGENLRDITLIENGQIKVTTEDGIPAPVIYMEAERRNPTDEIYYIKNSSRSSFTARLIPYFSFSNRDTTDMIVWTMIK